MISCELYKTLRSSNGNLQLEVTMTPKEQSFNILYGASGAGKTSILRMIAGLMSPDRGQIRAGTEQWYDHQRKINLKPQQRKLGFVFQDFSLFPNMTVWENILYPLNKSDQRKDALAIMERFELGAFRDQNPLTLSGGQKQKVALARALVKKPRLLLLDEPLSAVDHQTRLTLQDFILETHKDNGLTTIMVSHDHSEINRMSDQLYFLENGKISTPINKDLLKHDFGLHGLITNSSESKDSVNIEIRIKKIPHHEYSTIFSVGDEIRIKKD